MLEAFHFERKYPFTDLELLIPLEEYPRIRLTEGTYLTDWGILSKELMDFFFSFLALIVLSPFFILFGILIKLDSPGPIFFKQERVGMDGKKFKIIKFRTMNMDAEKIKKNLSAFNEASGPVFKIKKDPRITRVGRVLRKISLDELPQLWNILKGDMSLIGPRPPLESEVRQYEKWQLRRLSVRPGLTCTWQIAPNRHDIDFDDWVQMDLDYMDSWDFKKDTKIFFQTIKTVLSSRGY